MDENRIACPDGNCIGIIVDGKCCICKKALLPIKKEGLPSLPSLLKRIHLLTKQMKKEKEEARKKAEEVKEDFYFLTKKHSREFAEIYFGRIISVCIKEIEEEQANREHQKRISKLKKEEEQQRKEKEQYIKEMCEKSLKERMDIFV